jgi:hypothetical protein
VATIPDSIAGFDPGWQWARARTARKPEEISVARRIDVARLDLVIGRKTWDETSALLE